MKQFMNALSQKESKKIEDLYIAYREDMLHIAKKILRNHEAAEDAVQDAFCKAMQHLEKLDEIHAPTTRQYLIRIVKSCAIDRYRTYYREREALQEKSQIFQEWYEDADFYNLIFWKTELQKLSSIDQKIIYYRYVCGYSLQETAELTGLSPTNIGVRTLRCKKRWKQHADF